MNENQGSKVEAQEPEPMSLELAERLMRVAGDAAHAEGLGDDRDEEALAWLLDRARLAQAVIGATRLSGTSRVIVERSTGDPRRLDIRFQPALQLDLRE